jgi:hypothetical protein
MSMSRIGMLSMKFVFELIRICMKSIFEHVKFVLKLNRSIFELHDPV